MDEEVDWRILTQGCATVIALIIAGLAILLLSAALLKFAFWVVFFWQF